MEKILSLYKKIYHAILIDAFKLKILKIKILKNIFLALKKLQKLRVAQQCIIWLFVWIIF